MTVLLAGMFLFAPGHQLAAKALPDSSTIILSLPHLIVPAEADNVVMDVSLRNLQAAVGGLRVDLDIAAEDVTLDTVLTTARTSGWRVDLTSEPGRALQRILLFHPGGRDIVPGSGAVMRLVLALPAGGTLPAEIPLILAAATVSDPVGVELLAELQHGSLSVGAQVLLSLGSAQADQGETARLPVALSNAGRVAGFQASFGWDSTAFELLDVATSTRSARLQLEWALNDSGAWVWLFAPAGKELRPGSGDILTLSFAVAEGAYARETQVAVRDARVMEHGGRQRILIGTAPGRLSVFPGYLDPPRDLIAISGQDGRVPLSWVAPSGWTTPPILGQPSLAPSGYYMYRAEAPPVPRPGASPLATLAAAHQAYVDTTVMNGQVYFYAVTATYAHRFESSPSDLVAATPSSWVAFSVGHATAQSGEWAVIPIRLKNELPVAGVRFDLHGVPARLLFDPRVELGRRSPPDWVVSVEQDTVAGTVSAVGFSPRLTTIGPGEGVVFRLLMKTAGPDPATVLLTPENVVISDGHGDAYSAHASTGSVTITLPRVELRIGTGAPTQPGDTGYVAVYMDNPLPVTAFQLRIKVDSDALQVVGVQETPRLPSDSHLTRTDLGGGDIRLIGASFANRAIASGTGPVARIAYRVAPGTAEGLIGVELADVELSAENGRALRGTSISGAFPVGTVRAVFAAAASEGEPGRTVTLPVGVTNSVNLCGFQFTLGYDAHKLTLLHHEDAGRVEHEDDLKVTRAGTGLVQVAYAPATSGWIPAGTGPLLNLVFVLDQQAPADTSLVLSVGAVSAVGCEDLLVFATGREGEVRVGRPLPKPTHFRVDLEPTGVTHYIQVRATTLGGEYLVAGDELAVIDSSWGSDAGGRASGQVVGAGVLQPDGSVNISAVTGFDAALGAGNLAGAQTGGPIYYQAWSRKTNADGRTSTDARYVLGAGVWGENNGLTIVDLVRVPAKISYSEETLPAEFRVVPHTTSSFDSTTTIRFDLPAETEVRVAIFDLLGRKVIALHDGQTTAGHHEVRWNGTDAAGMLVKSGMYFYQVRTPDRTVTRKLLLVR